MGNITRSFSIDVVGVTTFVIFRWRKVSDPTVEIDRRVFGPAPAVTNNFSITDLDPVTYEFDTYVSSDGVTLNTLFATYTMDVKNNVITNERWYYVVGSGVGNAPAADTQSLVDSNLDGKTVTGVFQRAFGYLLPTSEWVRTSGGVDLVGALEFNQDDVYIVEVSYVTQSTDTSGGVVGLFSGIKVITANTTLDNTYYQKRIKLNGAAPQLVVTMDSIGNIPDGRYFYFVDNDGGAQLQTKVVSPDGSFKWNGNTTAEIWVGKGEHLWVEKQGSNFELVQAHPGLTAVYEIFEGTCLAHPNALPEDNTLFSADDYPRIWWFLNNKLSPTLVISDNNLDLGGYVRPANKQGQFIISASKRKFRMPDTRNLSKKGLARFDAGSWNLDATRAYDYPGGFQDAMVLRHRHVMHGFNAISGPAGLLFLSRAGGTQGKRYDAGGGTDNFGGSTTPDTDFLTGDTGGDDNIVKNFGVIHFRRI
ncbi:hypothetical protein [Puia sp.]|jgi:hypothetical protein|uniref:hypothetical protein n=1 Tax=Puia sp. TaxID=2045100 RepID=UPI002F3EDEA6